MKEQFIKNAREQFLRETVEFYNKNNRGTKNGGCQYAPLPHSPGCAIGRHVANKKLCEQWDSRIDGGWPAGGLNAWPEKSQIDLGPLAALGFDFLITVQELHDNGHSRSSWADHGLSYAGAVKVKRICDDFGLDSVCVLTSQTYPAE